MTEKPRAKKSTNVRSPALLLLRAALRGIRLLGPSIAARAAGVLFRVPPRHRTSQAERELLETGGRRFLPTASGRLATWQWGEGPAVLLVHGWGSRGARLGSFVEPIVTQGFSAVTFDAAGHGDSAGRLSSLPQFIDALFTVSRAYGSFEALVAHSMGGAAAALAMARGLPVGRAVFLAPAANPGAYSRLFAETLGIPDEVREAMERQFEQRFGLRWEDCDVPRSAASITTPLLVIHDKDDTEVPWSDGESIARAWPGAQMVTMSDLGHKRIVHDSQVISRSISFLFNGGRPREVGP